MFLFSIKEKYKTLGNRDYAIPEPHAEAWFSATASNGVMPGIFYFGISADICTFNFMEAGTNASLPSVSGQFADRHSGGQKNF